MNDPNPAFVKPRPEASWLRQKARAMRRGFARSRRDHTDGVPHKRWNIELNWREFWHGRTHLESTPRLIQVGTNWTCNLKCNFCRLTMEWTQTELRKLDPKQREISPRVFEVVKRLLPGAEMMVLTPLGEPFLWSRLDDLLDYHAKIGSHNLALTTNGMLLNDKNCERIVRGQLSHMFCSIDSNDPEIYAGMRVGGDLKRVEEGIRRLGEWKRRLGTPYPQLTCNATFLKRNIPQVPSMVEWAKDLGFEELSVQLMEIENPELESEFLGHDPELAHDHVLAALEKGREIGLLVRPHPAIRNLVTAARAGRDVERHDFAAAAPNMPEERKRTPLPSGNGSHLHGAAPLEKASGGNCGSCGASEASGASDLTMVLPPVPELPKEALTDMTGRTLIEKCHYPWYNMLIDTDGDARPCCWADVSWGNLNDLEFDEVWNGQKAIAMRQAFLANKIPGSCRKKHCRVDL